MFNARQLRHQSNRAVTSAYEQLVAHIQRLPFELQMRILMLVLRTRGRRRNRLRPYIVGRQVVRRGPVGQGFTRATPAQQMPGHAMVAQSRYNRAQRRRRSLP